MASIGNISAQGSSRTQYNFALYPIDTDFKPLGGVYIFLRGKEPVYVGQTGDLSGRFDDHHKAVAIERQGANQIGILLEANERKRLQIESDLLGNYNWPCNG